MKLYELLKSCRFEDIAPYLSEKMLDDMWLYQYKEVFDCLCLMKPVKSDVKIEVFVDQDIMDMKFLTAWPCEMCSWAEALGRSIALRDGLDIPNERIAATIIWHLTFYGTEEHRQELFDNWFEEKEMTRRERREDLIRRIISGYVGFEGQGCSVDFLSNATDFNEYKFTSFTDNADERISYLLTNIRQYCPPELFSGNRYLLLVQTAPEHKISGREMNRLLELVDFLKPHGYVSFGFGEKEGLGINVSLTVVRAYCTKSKRRATWMDFTIEEFPKGELTLLAGSPECGKTSFAISMALAQAEEKQKSLYISLINAGDDIRHRMKKQSAGEENSREIRDRITVDSTLNRRVEHIREQLLQHKDVKFVFIDCVNLMEDIFSRGISRRYELLSIFTGLQSLAKEFSVSVIGLFQYPKGCDGDSDRPDFSGIQTDLLISDFTAFNTMHLQRPYQNEELDEKHLENLKLFDSNGNKRASLLCFDRSTTRVSGF